MKKPTNAIAETVESFVIENENLQSSIDDLQKRIDKNNLSITALSPLGTWEDIVETSKDNSTN
jgi:sugar phosphate isomerase/epimerase